MTVQAAIPAMKRVNHRVPSMAYAADVSIQGQHTIDYGTTALVTADADGIIDGQSIAAAGSLAASGFNVLYSDSVMGRYGRNVQIVSDGAATSTATVYGYDYLGQYMAETLTLNGATPVLGVKCFFMVTSVTWALTAGRTIDVGWGDRLGVPYKILSTGILNELVSDATPGNAGAVVAGVVTQSLTSGDPRGYYAPHASFVPNGTRTHRLTVVVDRSNLHGSAHVNA
jgi:hypothetical protein